MAVASDSSSNKALTHNMYKEQYLFLLEFFVYSITGERLTKLNQIFCVPTSVHLRFLNLDNTDDVEITPVDPMFSPLSIGTSERKTENFYSGRSVLFAIPYRIVVNKNTELKINIEIYKKMPKQIRSDIMVGTGELDMTQEFVALRKEMFNCWHRDIPPPKCYEGPIQLYYQHELAVIASVFVRISGFGQSIITEFNAPPDQLTSSSFVFKGDERDCKAVAYKCKIISQSQMKLCKEPLLTKKNIKPSIQSHYRIFSDHIISNNNIIAQNDQDNYKILENDVVVRSNEDNEIVRPHRNKLIKPCENSVVLKVSGLLIDANGNMNKPTVTVSSESEHANSHDVFVLRIGKKGVVGEGERSDIQVEMRTPKGPIKRPPIRYETREIQTDLVPKSEDTVNKVEKNAIGKKKKKKKRKKKKN